MREAGDRQGFLLEPSQPFGVAAKPGGEHLDGDMPLQPRVVGAVYGAHPAGAEEIGDLERPHACARRYGHSRGSWHSGRNFKAILNGSSGLRRRICLSCPIRRLTHMSTTMNTTMAASRMGRRLTAALAIWAAVPALAMADPVMDWN